MLGRRSDSGPFRTRPGKAGLELLVQQVPQALEVRGIGRLPLPGQAAGLTQGADIGQVLGAGPAAAFLGGPVQQGRQLPAPADVKRPDPFGGVKFVPRHGEKIHPQFLHVHLDLAHALGGVGMQRHAGLPGDGGDLGDGRQGPGLVVGVHDTDQDGVGGQGPAHRLGVHQAL